MRQPDEQQALLISILSRASGEPVSYRELRDAGIEYPASVASELELAGVALERCYEGAADSRRLLGVRLDPNRGRACATPSEHVEKQPASSRGQRTARWLAPAALIAAAAALAGLALAGTGGGHAHQRQVVAHRAAKPARSAERRVSATPPVAHAALPPARATAVSPALAAQLEARGHALLGAEQFSRAVPVLRQALAATGENLNACLEPVREACLTYAYALYDLGRALRLAGQPAAAVPILERRLQIANQQPTVQGELELARRGAAGPATASVTG